MQIHPIRKFTNMVYALYFPKRSQCSVVCKWNYIVDETGKVQGWSKDLLEQVGLGELLDNNAGRIGN